MSFRMFKKNGILKFFLCFIFKNLADKKTPLRINFYLNFEF